MQVAFGPLAALCITTAGVDEREKSGRLLSVSVRPPEFRTAVVVEVRAAVAVPSGQLPVPYAILSTSVPAASEPHATFAFVALKSATFPLDCDIERFVV